MANITIRFAGDDPRIHTMIGQRGDGLIRLQSGPGFGLFGPYVNLPAGRCIARIIFDGKPSGRATMDICTNAGQTVLASRELDLGALKQGRLSVELPAELGRPHSACEVRLLCEPDIHADISSVEIEFSQAPDVFQEMERRNARERASSAIPVVPGDRGSMWGRVFDLNSKQLVELDGFSLYVMPDDFIGAGIIADRSYEPHVSAVIRSRLKPSSVFVDIGANIGYFTMLASTLAARVIAVEPNPSNRELIRASIEHAGARNVTVHPYALSDRPREVRLVTLGSNGAIVAPDSPDQTSHITAQAVEGDTLLENEARIDLVKMDVEMHEAMALRGLEKTMRRHRPELIFEFHPSAMREQTLNPRPDRLLDQIVDYGYVLSIIMPDGTLRATWPSEVSAYRLSLGVKDAHLDLFASPVSRAPS